MRTATEEASARRTRSRGENFPVALRVLPRAPRRHLNALYDFARHVDDLGDESPDLPTSHRLAQLDELEAQLRGQYAGRPPQQPVLRALAPTIAECDLPLDPLLRLIEANRVDQHRTRYDTFDQLRDYCTLSADPVGELVLHVFGQAADFRVQLSDRICTALQLIEHVQDVGEDYHRGRVYLPAADLRRFRVSEAELGAAAASDRLRQLLAFQAARAGAWLDAGAPLVAALHGWARLAVEGYLAGGRAALAVLAADGYNPLPRPRKPGGYQVLAQWLTARARSAG